jgi:SAM-dependent methyltransferase
MAFNKPCPNYINDFCEEPSDLLEMIAEDLPESSQILDIGSAYGTDALYLASLGHHITAVEKSEAEHSQLKKTIAEKKITNITPVNDDILNFEIEKDKYFLISLQNIVQFLPKEKNLELLRAVKDKVAPGGLIAISAFTVDDASYRLSGRDIRSYFEYQELLRLFDDFLIIYYFEKIVFDPGHASTPMPHYHGVARIIAKKNEKK